MISKILFLLLISMTSFAEDVKVMIIDTGVDPLNLPYMSYLDKSDIVAHPENYTYEHPHGTFITGQVTEGLCSQIKIYSCTFYKKEWSMKEIMEKEIACINRAHTEKMQFINYSSSGEYPNIEEYEALKLFLSDRSAIVVAAVGNDKKDLGNPCFGGFPACYRFPNMIEVGNLDEDGSRHFKTNYGMIGMTWEIGTNIWGTYPNNKMGHMTGSSQSAAIVTNKLLKTKCEVLNK